MAKNYKSFYLLRSGKIKTNNNKKTNWPKVQKKQQGKKIFKAKVRDMQTIKTWNQSNIPRNINTKVRKPMDKYPQLKHIFQKADPKLYRQKGHKISCPLFLFKLHSQLRVLPNHLEKFKQLTQAASNFVEDNIKQINKKGCADYQNNLNYDRKFKAYQKLLSKLRQKSRPTRSEIQETLKTGIYGVRKGKFDSPKVTKIINRCFAKYEKFIEVVSK